MHRIRRPLPGRQVAPHAVASLRQSPTIIVVDVAGSAGRRDVGARERETN